MTALPNSEFSKIFYSGCQLFPSEQPCCPLLGGTFLRVLFAQDILELMEKLVRGSCLHYDSYDSSSGVDFNELRKVFSSGLTDGQAYRLTESIEALMLSLKAYGLTQTTRIRVGVIISDECRKFHVDHLSKRFVLTPIGKGTEWIHPEDVDLDFLEQSVRTGRDMGLERFNQGLLRQGREVRHLDNTTGLLMDNSQRQSRDHFSEIFHRSPAIDPTEGSEPQDVLGRFRISFDCD